MYVFIKYKLQMFLASELVYLNGDMPWVLLEQRNIFINSMIDHILDSKERVPFVKQLEHEEKIKSPNFLYLHFTSLSPSPFKTIIYTQCSVEMEQPHMFVCGSKHLDVEVYSCINVTILFHKIQTISGQTGNTPLWVKLPEEVT